MAREMAVGDSASSTVGPSGSVVGKQNSGLMNTIASMILPGVMLSNVGGGLSSPLMRPGDSLMNVLAGNSEVVTPNPKGDLAKMVMSGALAIGMFKLVDAVSTPAPNYQQQEAQRLEAFAKEDARIAGIHKEDAVRAEFFATEDAHKKAEFEKEQARIAFFNKPPRM